MRDLLSLPDDLFLSGTPLRQLKENIRRGDSDALYGIDLSSLKHRLLIEANSIVDRGFNGDRYKAASKSAGRPVYEIRDNSSGCRGAMILDDDGDPWLVYAGSHDWSDAKVANLLTKSRSRYWMPTDLDMGIRKGEDAWLASRREAVGILDSLIRSVHGALQSSNETGEFRLPKVGANPGRLVDVEIISFKGQPLPLGQSGGTDAYMTLAIKGKSYDKDSRQRLNRAVSYLKPQEINFDVLQEDGSVYMEVTVSEAVIAQLYASVCLSSEKGQTVSRQMPDAVCGPQRVLHYVDTESFVQGMVFGKSALSLCGVWFIPSEDESSGKPVCEGCERVKPIFDSLHRGRV
ncbi:DUF3039 domain-containing protein [Bifidobacterium sp. ESL0790]|uniref:DUF3039 domain-containing protein n=1 Tax=Bifidobacterium sp. ESL0790 TaxID=2983233 RepID=UPI0023F61CF7|nr:DUF3039 domain-containing protein [Bifidobacterium sp. ESL0790]WEV72558.1 DUF3039 domain-containing protein [Bifidobacterium sp. ESL0790]